MIEEQAQGNRICPAEAKKPGRDTRLSRLSTGETPRRSRACWPVTHVKAGKTWYLPRSGFSSAIALGAGCSQLLLRVFP